MRRISRWNSRFGCSGIGVPGWPPNVLPLSRAVLRVAGAARMIRRARQRTASAAVAELGVESSDRQSGGAKSSGDLA
jgi:hypothetical protein